MHNQFHIYHSCTRKYTTVSVLIKQLIIRAIIYVYLLIKSHILVTDKARPHNSWCHYVCILSHDAAASEHAVCVSECQLQQLCLRIQQTWKTLPEPKPYTWKSVLGCAVFGSDSLWYRGQILSVLGGNVEVSSITALQSFFLMNSVYVENLFLSEMQPLLQTLSLNIWKMVEQTCT